ncbi:unnamed protein product [Parnassius apollo]|uniref:(apollo) hypothetical protein n=1 Tax=Parnassius apollo TaxID=110799 RepID=A0A8S3WMV4_PARAO|nr:unnamed protein product [Parnassius apollo]
MIKNIIKIYIYTVRILNDVKLEYGFSVVAPEVAVPGKTTAVLVTLHGRADNETVDPLNVTVRLETQDAENEVKLLTTASQMIIGYGIISLKIPASPATHCTLHTTVGCVGSDECTAKSHSVIRLLGPVRDVIVRPARHHYRPGETITFWILALDHDLRLVRGEIAYVALSDPAGTKVAIWDQLSMEEGVRKLSAALASGARSGVWRIEAKCGGASARVDLTVGAGLGGSSATAPAAEQHYVELRFADSMRRRYKPGLPFVGRARPLPGGRQGASGAGAGRDSMRAASRARGVARPPSSPPHPSSPPEGLVSAGSSRTQQAAPAAGETRRMRWSKSMNENALRAYFRAKGEETGCLAYRARMHRFFAELEPSLSVTEQNLADRVRYILRSNIFGDAELERLRREAIPSSNGNATAGNAAPLDAQQTAYVDAAVNIPFVANSDDNGIVSHQLEKMRSILEESMLETRSMPLENHPRLPRIPLSKRNPAVVRALNPMLVTYLEASRDLCETDSIRFGAALAVCRIIGAKLPVAGRATQKSSAIPAWRKRIEDRIAKTRALIGRLTSFRSGNNRPRIMRTVRVAFAGTNISLFQPDITQKLTERIDDLKQKIAAWGEADSTI